ncbi:MAG: lipopolysaccharide biosynthesis protein RfbH [Anaerolineae bacterium]
MSQAEQLRQQILDLVKDYHDVAFTKQPFVPGESPVPVSGRVFGAHEISLLVDSSLDFWLTTGRYSDEFEKKFASYMGVRHAMLCNSGSSANLLALSALTSPKLGKISLKPGDEVITVAAGFPTTVNPILQNQLVPVFVDIETETHNIDVNLLEQALSEKSRAVMIAHTLGNPFDLETVTAFCKQHNLYLIEDNCDALGTRYNGQLTGTFGDLATVSFYPAHHITMGEGGCVITRKPALKTLVESFRDWGRDCWCPPGVDNTCGKRFDWQLGTLPHGYDHKYTYSHVGYNLKLTDMQAAVGVAQLGRLDGFIEARRHNWSALRAGLEPFEEFFHLPVPAANSEPSWFGFLMSVREDAPFSRNELIAWLTERKIGTRLLFSGNLTRQPAYIGQPWRVAGSLERTDFTMSNSFWVGVYPGISSEMLVYIIDSIAEFVKKS